MKQAAPILKTVYRERTTRSPAYSLRAFARDLGVSHSLLSLVMNGRKALTIASALKICTRLGDEARWGEALLASAGGPGPSAPLKVNREFFVLEQDRAHLLREWYHLAILDLTELQGSRPHAGWISERLGITVQQSQLALDRLVRLGLLEITTEGWKKRHSELAISTRHEDEALRGYHRQAIQRALKKLEAPGPEAARDRDITGALIPVNRERLEEGKRRIAKFRRQLLAYLSKGPKTELFQLNVQLFKLGLVVMMALTACGQPPGLPVSPGAGAEQPKASGGTDIGSAGEFPDFEHGTAWFPGDRKTVSVCIRRSTGFPFTREALRDSIRDAFATWAKYLEKKHVMEELALFDPTMQPDFQETCTKDVDLTYYFGDFDDSVRTAQRAFENPFAFAKRTRYDMKEQWGQGYIAFEEKIQWTPRLLRAFQLHELGHVLGNDHVPGTIMDAGLARMMSESHDFAFDRVGYYP
jgi:hypothetical protein